MRKRRFSLASRDLASTDDRIVDIAVRYRFGTHESFTRAFRRETGMTPNEFRTRGMTHEFRSASSVDRYYEVQDEVLPEKYSESKVLKEVEPFTVAYYRHVGTSLRKGPGSRYPGGSRAQDWIRK